jgi:hypothetical protein
MNGSSPVVRTLCIKTNLKDLTFRLRPGQMTVIIREEDAGGGTHQETLENSSYPKDLLKRCEHLCEP